MLRIHDKTKRGFYPWTKNVDYDNFNFTKNENFDFEEYYFVSPTIKSCCLTAEVLKLKGEKVTESDLNYAFAHSLFVLMTTPSFNDETALNYFTTLPPEFYTKESFAMVCEKMKNFEYQSPEFEQSRLHRNFELFHDFAHKVNPEEIPAPTSSKNIDWLSKTK